MKPRVLVLVLIGGASVAGAASGTGPDPMSLSPGTLALPSPPATPTGEVLSQPDYLDRALSEVERQARVLRRESRDLDRRDAAALERSVAFGRSYVRALRVGLLPVAGGFDGFIDHAARVERLRKAAARELAERQRIARQRLEVRRRLADLDSRLVVLRANQQAMAQARTALLAQRDRAAAFERAFSSNTVGHTAVYGSGVGPLDPTLAASGFVAMKGNLPFPIEGRTEIHDAARPGIEGPGLEIQAPVGTPIRVVFPGRVAFADEYGAYGRTVIVDHGDRYFTVSAGLEDIEVEVRDELAAGERIGTVGMGPSGPGVYFEIRRGAETLEPDEWFGL
jgi:murein DD-endopeptidase MepM/ murein hydrolase activator NlpD